VKTSNAQFERKRVPHSHGVFIRRARGIPVTPTKNSTVLYGRFNFCAIGIEPAGQAGSNRRHKADVSMPVRISECAKVGVSQSCHPKQFERKRVPHSHGVFIRRARGIPVTPATLFL